MIASGMPVVATIHADIPEIVFPGENGLLVDERDADALATAILTLIDNSDQWHQMGKAGRRIVLERFNLETQIAQMEDLYQRLLP